MDRLTPEQRSKRALYGHSAFTGGTLGAIEGEIRAAVAARDAEWRDALMLWSGGSGLTMTDEFSGPLRKLMEEKNG